MRFNSKFQISDRLIQHINQLPGIIFFKDIHSRYREVSNDTLQFIGKIDQNIIGRTDFDLPWAEEAEKILEHDKSALSNFIYSQVSWHRWRWLKEDEKSILIITKWPLYNRNNDLIGIWGNGINLPVVKFNSLIKNIENYISLDKKPIFPNSYLVNNNKEVFLTPKQAECLYFILKGYTSKLIARHLGVSHRTIEVHIRLIHKKFKVHNKSELIKKLNI